jgi:zinc/manganese transport system ATP-binding protein
MKPHLAFENLTLGYDRHPAVHHLDGVVEAGSLTALVGPNGSGKSTLLKGIVGMLRPLGGRLIKADLRDGETAYLPQLSEIDRSFPASVADLVSLGLWNRRGMLKRITHADREAIDTALAAVGLTGFQSRGIETLSGGQLQRALFARVLLQDARLILLDEPFTAIDAKTAADLFALVQRWHREERTVLAVLHDLELVRTGFPQTLLLAREPVAWGATADVLTPENLLLARRMCEAFDESAGACAHQAA